MDLFQKKVIYGGNFVGPIFIFCQSCMIRAHLPRFWRGASSFSSLFLVDGRSFPLPLVRITLTLNWMLFCKINLSSGITKLTCQHWKLKFGFTSTIHICRDKPRRHQFFPFESYLLRIGLLPYTMTICCSMSTLVGQIFSGSVNGLSLLICLKEMQGIITSLNFAAHCFWPKSRKIIRKFKCK